MASPRFCNRCGQELRTGALFCTGCGRELPVRQARRRPARRPGRPGPARLAQPITCGPRTTGSCRRAQCVPAAPRRRTRHQLSRRARRPGPGRPGPTQPPARRQCQRSEPTHTAGIRAPFLVPACSSSTATGQEIAHRPASEPEPPKRSRRAALLVALAVVLIIGAGAAVALVVLPSHHTPDSSASHKAKGVTTQRSAAASPAADSPAVLPPREQAAQALAALLAQSGADRNEVTNAVNAVEACSGGLSRDQAIFTNAESSRQALLARLASLPDRAALPASMLTSLTRAWQASGAADHDFAQWTADEISAGCTPDDQSDASFRASSGPDGRATRYKKAFARQWAAIASEYGLRVVSVHPDLSGRAADAGAASASDARRRLPVR